MFFDQIEHFTRFGMPPGVQLGIEELLIYFHFKPASVGRNESDGFCLRFQVGKDIGCQTDSPGCIVSNRAVGDGDFEQHGHPH
jgi:hypothetical protein